MNGINIPGSPGTAMALAAGASIWVSGKLLESIAWDYKIGVLFGIIGSFISATIFIEWLHIDKEKTLKEKELMLKDKEIKIRELEKEIEQLRKNC